MKRLLLIVGIIVSLSAPAQQHPKLALINEAELAIVDENLEKAANIYDKLFLQKDQLWAQDLYNAAVVEMKLGSFEYAKKYLNELAKRGVAIEEIEEKEVFQEAFEWENYKVTYSQFQTFQRGITGYDELINQFNAAIDSLNRAGHLYWRKVPRMGRSGNERTVEIEDEQAIIFDTNLDIKLYYPFFINIKDSVCSLPHMVNELKLLNIALDSLVDRFTIFLTQNDFPFETDFPFVSLNPASNSFNLLLKEMLQLSKYEYKANGQTSNYVGDQFVWFPEQQNGKQKRIIDLIGMAVNKGRIKPEIAFQAIFPHNYYILIPFRVAMVNIESNENCEIKNNQMYLSKANEKESEVHSKWGKVLSFSDEESLKKKFIYQVTHNSFYVFNNYNRVENAQFSSCDAAKKFLLNAEVIK